MDWIRGIISGVLELGFCDVIRVNIYELVDFMNEQWLSTPDLQGPCRGLNWLNFEKP